jgi:hypothetical protein
MSKTEPKVTSFSGSLAGSVVMTEAGRLTSKRIEAAMNRAVEECYAEGITDPAVHLERKLAARQAEKQAISDEQAAAARAAQDADEA